MKTCDGLDKLSRITVLHCGYSFYRIFFARINCSEWLNNQYFARIEIFKITQNLLNSLITLFRSLLHVDPYLDLYSNIYMLNPNVSFSFNAWISGDTRVINQSVKRLAKRICWISFFDSFSQFNQFTSLRTYALEVSSWKVFQRNNIICFKTLKFIVTEIRRNQ